jgi:hypothetical protein
MNKVLNDLEQSKISPNVSKQSVQWDIDTK